MTSATPSAHCPRRTNVRPRLETPDGTGRQGLPTALDLPVTVAIDTEFVGAHTLTIQAATRVGADTLVIQLYRSQAIPAPSRGFDPRAFLPAAAYGRFFGHLILRPTRLITADLSPTRIVRDLLDIPDLAPIPRARGLQELHDLSPGQPGLPENLVWDQRRRRWRVPPLNLTVVGHFLPADFYRMFGGEFLQSLRTEAGSRGRAIEVRDGKRLGFRVRGRMFEKHGPVLEYARLGGDRLHEVRVATRDTALAFGKGGLDAHSRTFLGLTKSDALAEADKRDMLRTFRERTRDAYGYATVDAVNTLLIYEQMREHDRQIYRSFGFAEPAIPEMKPTLGGRVADFLVRATKRTVVGSQVLSSGTRLRELMGRGGVGLFDREPRASRFGPQTGGVHGGLLCSRTPTRFWHEAPRQFRDVDMEHCYNRVLVEMTVYWGRPVIVETGDRVLKVGEAVRYARRHADDDGWLVRVTGAIGAAPNALIPSTVDALTSANLKDRRRKRHAGRRGPGGGGAGNGYDQGETGRSRLYSAVIESGVVTAATWAVIRALPPALRAEYEALTADAVVLYPRKLTAATAAGYDRKVARYTQGGLGWESTLDLDAMRVLTSEAIDASYVTLRFPIGKYARKFSSERRKARRSGNKGLDRAWKEHGNTAYGVLASPHMPTNNFVAANLITARVRAEAFVMVQALNGYQVITDGCTYRRDQIPACTFSECLRLCPDYPVRRAEADSGVPFVDPDTIPGDDAGFTAWYRDHVRRIFGAPGPVFDALIATHDMAHKTTGESDSVAFDALATDGCSNYLKATADGRGGWRAEDFAARSYGKTSKAAVCDWILETYPGDRLTELPPLTEDTDLMKTKQAAQKARAALAEGVPDVYVPLGMEHRRVNNYRALKASAFVFGDPKQRHAVVKQIQKFEEKTGCGLELLAMRRSYAGRRGGSPADIAAAVYRTIRAGGHDLTKALNLTRKTYEASLASNARRGELESLRESARADLRAAVDVRRLKPGATATGLVVTAADRAWVDASR